MGVYLNPGNKGFWRAIRSEDYAGEILLVGVNYDKGNPDKPHSCLIEKVEKGR